MPELSKVPSARQRMSADEWQARVELAAAYRLVAHYGWTHLINNHISLRVPGTLVRRSTTIEVRVARFPLDMREYGITPPSRFLGAVKVRPDVHVNATLVFGP